jgi:tetratricopeptide (TPR) repeat protein
VEFFTKAIELAPNSADGYRGRANANYDRGETDAALADWDAAIQRNADDYALFVERGSLHHAKRNLKQAWDDYSAAIKLEPEQPEGHACRAELALSEDENEFLRPEEAFADAQRACEITKWKSATELALLAKACAAKKEFEEAVKWQQQALENADPLVRRQALAELEGYRRQLQAASDKK